MDLTTYSRTLIDIENSDLSYEEKLSKLLEHLPKNNSPSYSYKCRNMILGYMILLKKYDEGLDMINEIIHTYNKEHMLKFSVPQFSVYTAVLFLLKYKNKAKAYTHFKIFYKDDKNCHYGDHLFNKSFDDYLFIYEPIWTRKLNKDFSLSLIEPEVKSLI